MLRHTRSLVLAVAVAAGWPQASWAGNLSPRPRLVVVISIDQLRGDYLQRFGRYFSKGGLNLLLRGGAVFTDAHYRHSVTQTCPGHAVIMTGTHANINGIVANSWYNRSLRRTEYCAADTLAKLLGSSAEGRSPRNLLDSTVGDHLKLSSAGRSRVITVAGKDRSAIMMGGHLADAAYWTEDTVFVTSTYYLKELPPWVRRFNASGAVTRYRGATWNRLLPRSAYAMMGPDDVRAEEAVPGFGRTFPHRLGIRASHADFLTGFQTSPFENEVLVDFAMEAVREERLGRDDDPDVLAIGFSANDLVGHSYGPDSHEVMDMTLRTDRVLERFFALLEKEVGLERVLLVLTSDHGVAPLPEVARQGASGARLDPALIAAAAERALRIRFGAPRRPGWMTPPTWVMHQDWPWLYLNLAGLEDKNIPLEDAEEVAKAALEQVPGVVRVLTAGELRRQREEGVNSRAQVSFYPERSGNVYFELSPYVVPGEERDGTTHGSPWAYDTHVPLLWFGEGIAPGSHTGAVSVADIAPTLSRLLEIDIPSNVQGRVLEEMLR
ncbi:MAG TPA: alkaline phosphatase family protein [Gemmatimonadales bacterium]|nr:alkaline phosphatase family protein [Gemmatimonadales bacterium]